ncbi:MAG: hypothetical protein M2R45_04436 [Verrucomicrobia subdivision 3 bacterium]|nr:hypothetical protein [Limisphaerales bacterium]MCS1413524.1 hypothetical protein [Limisphaerales bacterium]
MGAFLIYGASGLAGLLILRLFGPDGTDFLVMIVYTVVFHGGVAFLVFLFLREQGLSWREGFGIQFGQFRSLVVPVIVITLACLLCAKVLGEVSAFVIKAWTGEEPAIQVTVRLLLESKSAFRLLYLALVAVILAPIVEELLFRGILYTALHQYRGRIVGVWGSSILFGVSHLNWLTLFPLIVMAVLLTLLYERTRNLLAPMMAHSLFNLANFVLLMNQEVDGW